MSRFPTPLRLSHLSATAALLVVLASVPALVGQAQAQGSMQTMPGMSGGKAAAATNALATGTVEAVSAEQRKIKLNHEPIPAINWPAMSMEFPAAAAVDLSKVKPGDKVKFTLSKGANGSYTVESLGAAQ